MLDASDLVRLIKQTAIEAVNASSPTSLVFGTVISASPLEITIEQKLTLTSAQLVLARDVTDYNVDMTVNHSTVNAGISLTNSETSHSHSVNSSATSSVAVAHTHTYERGEETVKEYQTGDASPSTSHAHSVPAKQTNGNGFSCQNVGGHTHGYVGRKTFLVHNALKVGEDVLLMQMQGGQKYLVIDRVVKA